MQKKKSGVKNGWKLCRDGGDGHRRLYKRSSRKISIIVLLYNNVLLNFYTISWLLKIIITAIFVTRIQTWSSPSVWEWQVTNRWRGSVTNWRTGSRGCRRSFADLCHFIQQTNSLGVGWAVRKEQMLGNKSGNAWSNTITRVLQYCYTKVKGSLLYGFWLIE